MQTHVEVNMVEGTEHYSTHTSSTPIKTLSIIRSTVSTKALDVMWCASLALATSQLLFCWCVSHREICLFYTALSSLYGKAQL